MQRLANDLQLRKMKVKMKSMKVKKMQTKPTSAYGCGRFRRHVWNIVSSSTTTRTVKMNDASSSTYSELILLKQLVQTSERQNFIDKHIL
jgi:hypothetical protein